MGVAPLREALIQKDNDTALMLLKEGANPNEFVRKAIVFSNKHLLSYTPLAIAALLNDMTMVSALLEAKASTESTYSLQCGAQRVEHIFYVGTAAVVHANVDMLKLLVSHGMDLGAIAPVNKANLLWEAAYGNKVEVARYLLDNGVNTEQAALFQDDRSKKHTPLHIASKFGNSEVVKLLLEFRAKYDVNDGCTSPLDDAIVGGYVETVSMLVGSGAVSEMMWSNTNPVTILSVAKGLAQCPKTLNGVAVDQMRNFFDVSSHLSRFMLSILLPSLFVRKPTQCLMYWTLGLENRVQRATFNLRVGSCWQMADYWALHTAPGPHEQVLQTKYRMKESIVTVGKKSSCFETFIDTLLPQREASGTQVVQTGLMRCRVPEIHKEFRLLLAIVECQGSEHFKSNACQAIIDFWWNSAHMPHHTKLHRVWQMTYVLTYGGVLWIMRYGTVDEDGDFTHQSFWQLFAALLALLSVYCCLEVLEEVCQALGYRDAGFLWHYLLDWWNGVEFMTVGFSALTLFMLMQSWQSGVMSPYVRRILAVMIFWRWIHMTKHYVSGVTLGPVVLPILKASGEIRGFFFVVGVCLMAFISGYLALVQEYPLWVVTFSAYRTAIFGEGALVAVEDEAVVESTGVKNRFGDEIAAFPLENAFMSTVAFCLGVVLMNIFIAVLSINYEREYNLAWSSFLRSRASATADMAACSRGFNILMKPFFPVTLRNESVNVDHGPTYLWVSCESNVLDSVHSRIES